MNDPTTPPPADRDPIRAARAEAGAAHVTPADAAVAGERAGDRIDRYKLLQCIGEGGMGTVWMAEQSEPVRRKVALKIIKLGMDTKEVVVRFEAERQALALMEHPSIARVLDGGATATGRPYFVMELVRGLPITQFCDESKLGVEARLRLFAQVCGAVQHAHQKGVVHRDLKPSNVMVTLHDGTPTPKVIDFGIAKATSAELTQKTLFTQFSQMVGTPEYMAPEQAELSALDVDTRADVYSLGVLLYELLTGTTPFVLREVLERGYAELVRTIREDTPARPSTRVSTLGETGSAVALRRSATLDRLKTRLRGDLDRIVMKAMEKDRSRRYQTAHGFADDVGRYLRGEAVEAVGPNTLYRLRKFVLRRRKTVAALALLGLTLVLGATGTAIGWAEARSANASLQTSLGNEAEQRRIAVAEAERATRAERQARTERDRAVEAEAEVAQRAAMLERIATFQEQRFAAVDVPSMAARLRKLILAQAADEGREALADGLAQINLSNVGVGALQHEVLAPTIASIDANFADDPIVMGRLLAAVGRTQMDLGLVDEALVTHERALELRAANLPPDHEVVLDSMQQLSKCLLLTHETRRAEQLVRDTLARAEGSHDDLALCKAHYALGYLLSMTGRTGDALPHLRTALTGYEAIPETPAGSTAMVRDTLVASLVQHGEFVEAERELATSLAAVRAQFGEDSQQFMEARMREAHMLSELGRNDEAVAIARASLAGLRRQLGDDNPHTLGTGVGVGRILAMAGELDEAEAVLDDVLERARRVFGERAGFVRSALGGLGTVAGQRGDYARARELSAQVARYADEYELETGQRAVARLNEAMAMERTGDIDGALAAFHEARRLTLDGGTGDKTALIASATGIGTMLRLRGDLDEAGRWLRTAVDDARRELGPGHRMTLNAQNSLAVLLQSQVRDEEADAVFASVLATAEAAAPDSEFTQIARVNLATSRQRLGRNEEAAALIERALAGLSKSLPPQHPTLLSMRLRLVHTLIDLRRLDEASALCAEVTAGMVRVLGRTHHETLLARSTAMMVALAQDDLDAAIEVLRGLVADEAEIGPRAASYRAGLGGLLLERGRPDEAEPHLRAFLASESVRADPDGWPALLAHNRLATIAGLRGAFADGAEAMAESCAKLPDRKLPKDSARGLDQVALALERGVAFYEAWDRAEPGRGHDAKAAAVRRQLDDRRAEAR